MLEEALQKFLEGNNIFVTGWCEWYAIELQHKIASKMIQQNLKFDIKKGEISLNGYTMKFVPHNYFARRATSMVDNTWFIYMDHYRGPV